MEPLQKSAENSAARYPTSNRIHQDQNLVYKFCLKLVNNGRILTRHCISEYRETLNSKQKINAHNSTATSDMST